MALTRKFKDTIQARAKKDPQFLRGLLAESINEFLAGDLESSKSLLRDYINASISFSEVAQLAQISDKSLQRMLSSKGNPTTSNFCRVLQAIQEIENIEISVKVKN